MTKSTMILSALAGFAIVTIALPAQALTMQECSAKYEAAKTAGSLGGKKWNDFRKSECAAEATPAATPAAAPAATPAPAAPKAAEAKPAPKAAEAMKPAAAPVGAAAFPSAVSPKYASEKPGTARMHTCLDQYNANKVANTTGGLKWIEKGGGYYSQCNAKLKT